MKRYYFFALLLMGLLTTVPLPAQSVANSYDKNEYRIPMRDGVLLYTAVYTPKNAVDAPIIINRTPYGCRPYGPDEFARGLEQGYWGSYADRGYIIVFQDVRGRFMSQGEFVNIRPVAKGGVDETTDSYDTVDWLVKHIPGNNGRVGFTGCSYPGFYAMMGGLSRHPAVKAVSPQAPVTSWYLGDDTHHNGVLMLTDTYGFIAGMSHAGVHEPAARMPSKRKIGQTPDEYAFFLGCGTLDSLSRRLDPTPFWDDMAAHPDHDGWWQERDLRRACYDVQPAVLVVGGTFDAEDCYGAWNLYKALRLQSPSTQCHLVVGPWAHGAWTGSGGVLGAFDFGPETTREYFMVHFEIPFFDRYLKDADTPAALPAVSVFTSGDDRWRTFGEWTPHDAQKTTFYLQEGGRLGTRKPVAKSSYSSYTSDPATPVPYNHPLREHRDPAYMLADQRFTEGRADVLNFITEPLTEDITLAGPLTAVLHTAISTTDADFVVRLIDVFPDSGDKPGYRMLVRGEVMRGRYRHDFSRPEPFTPGKAAEVRFAAPDIAHTFRAGHRIQVSVQSSWFPLAERSPQQFVDPWRCTISDFIPCEVTIYHQQARASAIEVWKLPK